MMSFSTTNYSYTNDCDFENSLLENSRRINKIRSFRVFLYKWYKTASLTAFGLVLSIFIVLFIDLPIVFKFSIRLQQKLLFLPFTDDNTPEKFGNVLQYANGARNLYVTVNKAENITLGVWHYLPKAFVYNSSKNEHFDYDEYLYRSDYPVLLYFHGNGGNRIYNAKKYLILRDFFHVISFDYRSYGDSTKAELTEKGIVQDCTELYKWLKKRTTPNNIYVWGHSLGTALATHTIAKLQEESLTPMGLILESPFTTLREQVENVPFGKVYSWLPWFKITILDGLESNNYIMNTSGNILKVNCPIMILHAEDDNLVPYRLGEKLAAIAVKNRDKETQGNVTFHRFSPQFSYGHAKITEAPELYNYLRCHINICRKYREMEII